MDSETPMSLAVQLRPLARLTRYLSNKLVSLVVFIVLLAIAFGAGVQYGQKRAQVLGPGSTNFGFSVKNQQVPDTIKKTIDFAQFWQVWDLVSKQYYDKSAVDPQKMYYGAISGMVQALGDPYTTFLPPSENKEVKNDLGGKFSGVGIELGFKDNALVVIAPLDNTPAQRAGILAGDYITKIDGKETTNVTLPEAVSKIRGTNGTQVTLELYRKGDDKPYTTTLTRENIHVISVTFSKKEGNVGYIKLSRFGDDTNKEWDTAVTQALNANIKSMVIDVRNNPGGYLDSAIYVGSDFINGVIVKQEKGDNTKQSYSSVRMGRLLTMPVVVLLNKGSASASEILAGALRDQRHATLVGETSFGKGTVQEVQDFENGAGIHITRAKWLTPNDIWVHQKGLTPDVVVDYTSADIKAGKDPQLNRAIELAKSF